MKHYIAGIGEILWDILPDTRKLGGAPANFACHVSQFGLDGMIISAIGRDSLGKEVIKELGRKSIRTVLQEVPYPTGTVEVVLDGNGVPHYDIKEDSAWDNMTFTAELASIARDTRAACFGSLAQRNGTSRRTIELFLDAMDSNGEDTYKIFDINLRQNFYTEEIIESSLKKCNILKINDEELSVISRMFSLPAGNTEDICHSIVRTYGLKLLILTCGTNGSYIFSQEGTSFEETPKVTVADTVGAGDSFTAAFISSLTYGKSVKEAHRLAVKVSAFVCTKEGATPILPAELVEAVRH